MHRHVSVQFDPRNRLELEADAPDDAATQSAARDWLDTAYVEFGCEPLRPSGKVLLVDKVLAIALAAGARKFANDAAWANAYARAAAVALDRSSVLVDVENRTVGG